MKLKNILVIGLTSLTLASCNDFLDVESPSLLSFKISYLCLPLFYETRQATAKSSFSARKQKSTAHLMEYMHLSL